MTTERPPVARLSLILSALPFAGVSACATFLAGRGNWLAGLSAGPTGSAAWRGRGNPVFAQQRLQGRGEADRAVGLLVVFQDRHQSSADRHGGAV